MKSKNLFILFYCSIPLILFVRIFQLTQMIDPETGFYRDMFSAGGTLISASIAAVVVFFIILGRLHSKWPTSPPQQSRVLGGISAAMAVGLMLELFDFIKYESQKTIPQFMSEAELARYNKEQFAGFLGNGAYFIFIIAAVLFFILFARYHFTGKPYIKLLSVAPILWAALRLGRTFMLYTGIADISENLFDIMMLCLMLAFWLLHGRIISGFNYNFAIKWVFGFGLSASLLAIICTLPRVYLMAFTQNYTLHEASDPKIFNIICAFYIWYFLYRLSKRPAAKLKENQEEGEQ